MSTKIAYCQYNQAHGFWKCFNYITKQIIKLSDFQIMTTKTSLKRDRGLFFKNTQITHSTKQLHPHLKFLNLSTAKTKANHNIRARATNQELNHPCSNNRLFIDCFLSDNLDSFSNDVITLGANNVQTASNAVSHIFKYYGLSQPAYRILNSLTHKHITFTQARKQIEQFMGNKVIRFIPFGSQLQKELKKVLKKSGYGYEGIIGGCSDNLFGFFYLEDHHQNIIRDIIQKANYEIL